MGLAKSVVSQKTAQPSSGAFEFATETVSSDQCTPPASRSLMFAMEAVSADKSAPPGQTDPQATQGPNPPAQVPMLLLEHLVAKHVDLGDVFVKKFVAYFHQIKGIKKQPTRSNISEFVAFWHEMGTRKNSKYATAYKLVSEE